MKKSTRESLLFFGLAFLAFTLPALIPKAETHKHHLLVATEDHDTMNRFHKTVIYMINHDSFGAFGFIVNREAEDVVRRELFEKLEVEPNAKKAMLSGPHPVRAGFGEMLLAENDAIPEDGKDEDDDKPSIGKVIFKGMNDLVTVFDGGPVHTQKYHLLHTNDVMDRDSTQIPETDLALADKFNLLFEAVAGQPPRRMKIFRGYSGWGPKQLESEILTGQWYVIPYDEDMVFAEDVDGIWEQAIAKHRELEREKLQAMKVSK